MSETKPIQTSANNICVIGTGAIGSTLAIIFSQRSPTFFIYSRSHTPQASFPTKQLTGGLNLVAKPNNLTSVNWKDIGAVPKNTDYWIAVKSTDLNEVLLRLYPCLSVEANVILLQNGIGVFFEAFDVLRKASPILRALAFFGARKGDSEDVLVSGDVKLTLASLPEDKHRASAIQHYLEFHGIDGYTTHNIARAEWEKTFVNLVVNSLATLVRKKNGCILESPI
ncbi:MAG: hypothetical protein KDD53_07750, partial [Bdellovibrionales bacterium]|nr:hypothetical protein [Bdellovibrionales bacterium]